MNNAHYQTADGNENHHELLFRGVFVIKKKIVYIRLRCVFYCNLKTKKKSYDFFTLNFIALPCFKNYEYFWL